MHECQMSAMQSECSGLLDGATTLVAALHQSQRLLPMCMIVYNLKCFVTDTIHWTLYHSKADTQRHGLSMKGRPAKKRQAQRAHPIPKAWAYNAWWRCGLTRYWSWYFCDRADVDMWLDACWRLMLFRCWTLLIMCARYYSRAEAPCVQIR